MYRWKDEVGAHLVSVRVVYLYVGGREGRGARRPLVDGRKHF